MDWNNEYLNKVQTIENELFNCKLGSINSTFTSFIYNTDLWIDERNEKELLNYTPTEKYIIPEGRAYKKHFISIDCMKDISDNVARFIQLGSNLNVACILAGYDYNVLRSKFTEEHKLKFKIAREIKYSINKKK